MIGRKVVSVCRGGEPSPSERESGRWGAVDECDSSELWKKLRKKRQVYRQAGRQAGSQTD